MPSLNATDNTPFPRPFGGIPVDYDLIPTLLFTIGFATAFGINVYSWTHKQTRSLKLGSLCLSFERIMVGWLRSEQSLYTPWRESWGITEYLQMTYSIGFMSLLEEQLGTILCAATSATRDGLTFEEWIKAIEKNPGMMEARRSERKGFRKWASKMDWCMNIVLFAQLGISLQSEFSGHNIGARWILYCRFIANLAAFFITVSLLSMIYRLQDVQGVNRAALQRMKITLAAVSLVPLSHCFLSFDTATTLATSPVDPSTIASKLVFYLLQLSPELFACLLTAITNYRVLCDTGMWGDWPRSRVERGLPANLRVFAIIAYYLTPRRESHLLAACIRRIRRIRRNRRDQYVVGSLPHEDTQKLLPNTPSMTWQSTTHLSNLGDAEKQSVWTEWSFSSADQSVSRDSQTSSSQSHESLITDVGLWRPRLRIW